MQTRYYITPAGKAYQETRSVEEVELEPLFNSLVPEYSYLLPAYGKDKYLLAATSGLYAFKILDRIPVVCSWYLESNPQSSELPPVFMPSWFLGLPANSGLRTGKVFWYETPEDMRLIFGIRMDQQRFRLLQTYLLAQDRVTGGIYHPIIPNVHSDGKLCTGEVSLPTYQNEGIEDYLTLIYNAWAQGAWNGDLFSRENNESQTWRNWFSFDPETGKHLRDPSTNWRTLTTRIGLSNDMDNAFMQIHEVLDAAYIQADETSTS